jgi:uncharacterized protein YbjT (DUF2867 family)
MAVLDFFETSGRNLLAAESAADVRHHVALSVVGAGRLPGSGYMRGKVAQETLIRASTIPYTIVYSTQFFEFMGGIVNSAEKGEAIHLPTALIQPIAANDVAAALADVTLSAPAGLAVEIAGPERHRMSTIVQRYLQEVGDSRKVVPDPKALYFGVELDDESLLPTNDARIGSTRFATWVRERRKTG